LPFVPEAGAQCGNSARWDLCGGPPARAVPTATRYGVASKTFSYLRAFLWRRVVRWLHKKHPRLNWKQLRRRYLNRWWPTAGEVTLFNPSAVSTVRYRYRGNTIPSPWSRQTEGTAA